MSLHLLKYVLGTVISWSILYYKHDILKDHPPLWSRVTDTNMKLPNSFLQFMKLSYNYLVTDIDI